MPSHASPVEEVPDGLVAEPLNWFVAHHRRHRQMCRLIESLATDPDFDGARIRFVLDYLGNEVPLHLQDEEEDLFPLLRQRCEEADEVSAVLQQLLAEHRSDGTEADDVRGRLERCLALAVPPGHSPETRAALTDYADHERRHLALENAVVLPIARLRLSAEDLKALSQRLGRRRRERAPH